MSEPAPARPAPPARAARSESLKRTLRITLSLAGMSVCIALLVRTVDIAAAARAVRAADGRWLLAAVAAAVLLTVMIALRLWWLLRSSGRPRSFRACWSAIMASLTLNAVLPARAGDLIKAVFIARDRDEIRPMLGVMVIERLLDIAALASIAGVAAVVSGQAAVAGIAVALLAAAATLLALLRWAPNLLPQRMSKLSAGLSEPAQRLLARPAHTAAAFVVALACWAVNIGLFAMLLRAVGADPTPAQAAGALPLGVLVGALPISIAGIGTRDAVLVFLLRGVVDEPLVLAGSFLYLVVGYWFLAVVGLLSLGGKALGSLRRSAAAVAAVTPIDATTPPADTARTPPPPR